MVHATCTGTRAYNITDSYRFGVDYQGNCMVICIEFHGLE